MSSPEQPSQPIDPYEQDRLEALGFIVEQHFEEEDRKFLAELEGEGEQLGYVYGRLLEQGEDPDVIMKEFGVTEADDEV